MLFLLPHFLPCLILFICVSCEFIQNPRDSIISCGLTEDCTIICNQANSCESSEFYLYSNDAYIECSGQSSCKSLKIVTINTTITTLYINGINAFMYGVAYIQQSNSPIITHCLNQSCQEASFYYNGVGQNVEHYCKDIGSCNNALISALPIDVIYIECDVCNNMDIYTPMSITYISIINITITILSTHIYSIHGITNLNVSCNGNCIDSATNDMYIIYGINYQSYCAIYDVECMQSIDINSLGYQQNENMFIKYFKDGNYNGLVLDNTNILLFILPSDTILTIDQPSNIVKPTQSTAFIHVICVDHFYYPSCNNIHFNFSLTNHAILTANNAQSIIIIGPINDYKRIAYRNNNNNNIYHLQSTSNILLQCNQLKGGQCLNNSMLYTGSTTNVSVLCGANDCHYSTIHSDINPLQITQSLSTIGFNIICYPSSTSCTPLFQLNFSNIIICHSPNDPNCSFLSLSPTTHPTTSPITFTPSITPTISPTSVPTQIPTNTPTYSPSNSPTYTPVSAPTLFPTYTPTIAPTFSPSSTPTLSPTDIPSIAPSFSPTNIPSSSPTQPPSIAPTFNPTISPTLSPVQPPTNAPTFSPTYFPTLAPTQPPTDAPTHSPTFTPTHSPTNNPTSDIYKHVLKVDYTLSNITKHIFERLHDTQEQQRLEMILAQCYLLYSYRIIDDDEQYLHYRDFDLQIINVLPAMMHITPKASDTYMNQWFNYSGTLKCDIRYAEPSVGNDIHFITRQLKFQNFTQYRLRKYFNYDLLVLDISNPVEEPPKVRAIAEVSGFLIVIITIGGICTLIAAASFIYNNWIPNAVTDNGNSLAVLLLALQVIDFFSDINLCVEMFTEFAGSKQNNHPPIGLYIAAIGTLTFSILPYTTNLLYATNIKRIPEIKENPFAKSYFQTSSWFFIVLTVFCGGVYPSLSIVSSRLFGFEFLNSGLTMMELTKLTKIRFFTTILLENIPQLCCSIIYLNYLRRVSGNAVLSMVMSTLQIISAILNYCIVRKRDDCRVIEYDLEMKVGLQFKLREGIKASLSSISTMDVNDQEQEHDNDSDIFDEEETINSSVQVLETTTPSSSILTMEQKQLIRNKKERKHSLKQWLTTELSLRPTAIEIGYVTLTPMGCIIHIIHYLFESEAKTFRDLRRQKSIPPISTQVGNSNTCEIELENIKETEVTGTSYEKVALKSCKSLSFDNLILAKSRSYERWDGNEKEFKKTVKLLFKDLYKENCDRVNCAFAQHFGFKQEMVSVTYHRNYIYSDYVVMNKRNFSYRHLPIDDSDNEMGKYNSQNLPNLRRKTVEHKSQNTTPKITIDTKMTAMITRRSNRTSYEDSKSYDTPQEEMKVGFSKMEELSKIIIDKLDEMTEEQCKDELLKDGYDENLIDKIMLIGKYMSSIKITSSKYDSDFSDDKQTGIENENELLTKSEKCEENIELEQSEDSQEGDVEDNMDMDDVEMDNKMEQVNEKLSKIIINKLKEMSKEQCKNELLKEGYDEELIDKIMCSIDNEIKDEDEMDEMHEIENDSDGMEDRNVSENGSDGEEDIHEIENINELNDVNNENEKESDIGDNEMNENVKDNSDSDKENTENIRDSSDKNSENDNDENEEINNVNEENTNDNNVINRGINKQHPS